MKIKLLSLALIVAILAAGFGYTGSVQAASWGTKFITSITYQNVGVAEATVRLDFYAAESGTAIPVTLPNLAAGAGASVFVGGLTDVATGFQGSAVMSSSQPMVTVLVQIPQAPSTVVNRPLSSGFSTGAAYVLVPTVLKAKFNQTSIFTIQNVDTAPANIEVKFVPIEGTAHTITKTNVPAGAAVYFDASTITQIGTVFNGSVQVRATKAAGGAGAVVATSMELQTNNDNVYAFEGATTTARTVYMPSALCNYFSQNTFYAVQNTGDVETNVTVKYSSGKEESKAIGAGQKFSFPGCGTTAGLNADKFSGSATITSTAADIVAIGKITGGGLSTAFLGFTEGAAKIALPYIRWSDTKYVPGTSGVQRSFIAIQNIGTTDLADGTVTVKYYDRNGALAGTHTLGALVAGGKTNSNPSLATPKLSEFGYVGGFGGGAIVEGPAGSQLAVIVRVQSAMTVGQAGEDYNGTPVSVP